MSEKIYLCLAIELMGKYSNVILYSYDTNMIVGCAHNVGAEKSREREMAGGLPYVYPAGRPKEWYYNEYSLANLNCKSINSVIDDYYAECIYNDRIKRLKGQYSQLIQSKLKKDKNSLKKMDYKLSKEVNGDKYRLYGDLIMANLYNNKGYSKFIRVFDYENNKEINQIEIGIDNINDCEEVKKYKRSKIKNKNQIYFYLDEEVSDLQYQLEEVANNNEQVADLGNESPRYDRY